jgi:hypothetical protein
MRSWRLWRLFILLALIGGLAWILLNRFPIIGLAPVASIQTPYQTEHEWAIRETTIDIERMAAYAQQRDPRTILAPASDVPWDVDQFISHAADAFGEGNSNADFQLDLHPDLTALDVDALVKAGNTVSRALEANMRDPRAHESAALVVGAFALRDAADQFTDVRWALNRMTAHLAVARMLRKDADASPDGAIAGVILSTLSNQQARALTELASLANGTPPAPLHSWVRALTMRVNQDWRVLDDPATATRLEKLEYFRARRADVRRRRAAEDLGRVGEEADADFGRLAQDGLVGVEDGHLFVTPALDRELREARKAYFLVHERSMPDDLGVALNHRASYLVDGKPVVLPWGAWAEFYQRHIAMNMGMVDSHLRYYLGDAGGADEAKSALQLRLGKLTLFPLGTLRWTKGNNATEADMTYVADVVALSETAPELITERAWVFFEGGSRAEATRKKMPKADTWFVPATASVPFEAGPRNAEGIRARAQDLDALITAAPTDRLLLISAVEGAARGPAVTRAQELLRQRHAFDLGAIDASLKKEKDDAARAELERQACALSSRDCLAFAGTLALLGREEEAAREYERGLSDPEIDRVAFAADAGWLVDYYRRKGRINEARKLADDAASVGSAAGTEIRGELHEHLREFDAAEKDFSVNATQWNDPEHLIGFYYRRVEVEHDERYRQKWDKWRAVSFPNGLQPEPTSMTSPPKTGVYVYADTERSRQAGLRAGDIIVGLEGFRVDNVEQYQTINGFFEHPRVKLTFWRGSLMKVDAETPNRRFGTDIRTYPLKGWIE